MSYEEYRRTTYKACCACGNGFVKYQTVFLENDWNQEKEYNTETEIYCDCCSKKYHYENIEDIFGIESNGDHYLVPNGLTFKIKSPELDKRYMYDTKEKAVNKYGKDGIEKIIADMTAPKHRYIKDLTTDEAYEFANEWVYHNRQKSLSPMIEFLQDILANFCEIESTLHEKSLVQDKYHSEVEKYDNEIRNVEKQSFNLSFAQDETENENIHDVNTYVLEPFMARVKYDKTFSSDWTNQYWDTYFIKECTDNQYLILSKSFVGTSEITIAKKYKCVCHLCQNEKEVLSSDFKVTFDEEIGYYIEPSCLCHKVSSFEAKVMEILNNLGITYIREKTFDSLMGDFGKKLRFDFGLYKCKKEDGDPLIDLMIELQGPHHYKEGYYDEYGGFISGSNSQMNTKEKFERQQRNDEKKKAYCLEHGIDLECIKYTNASDYEHLEMMLIDILKRYEYKYLL